MASKASCERIHEREAFLLPPLALVSPLISRVTTHDIPEMDNLLAGKCAQECDGHVASLPRPSSFPSAPFMYTTPFPLHSNVCHAGVSRFGNLRYGSWFIEFWPGAAVRLGCTDNGLLTCILYLKFFFSVFFFSFFFFFLLSFLTLRPITTNKQLTIWTLNQERILDWTVIRHTLIVMKFFRDLDILHPSMVKCPACKK